MHHCCAIHTGSIQFSHQNFKCWTNFVFRSLFWSIQMGQLRERANAHVVSKMGEHCTWNTPLFSVQYSLFFPDFFPTFHCSFGCVSVGYFVESSQDITSTDILKWSSSLDEQTSLWNFNWFLFPVPGPYWKSRVSWLSMDSHKTDVVMPSCEYRANVMLLKVWASRC